MQQARRHVDDAADVARVDDLGADRERAAGTGRRLNQRRIARGRLVDLETADRAARPVDELGEHADRLPAIVVEQERRPRPGGGDRARPEPVFDARDPADLVVGHDDALDRPRREIGRDDVHFEPEHLDPPGG